MHLWILHLVEQSGGTKQAASFIMAGGGTIEEKNRDDGNEL